jgi:excisionase family DNA binding protein
MAIHTQATPSETLLTFTEAMAYLRVSRSTIYRLLWSGSLPGHKIGNGWRFYPSDLRAQIVRQQEAETVTPSHDDDNEQEWKASEHEPLSAYLDELVQPFVLARLQEYASEQKVSVNEALNSILRQYLYSEGM